MQAPARRAAALRILLALTTLVAAAAITRAEDASEPAFARGPFKFVSLPDTQVYAENRLPDGRTPAVTDPRGTGAIFFDQTEWVASHALIDYPTCTGARPPEAFVRPPRIRYVAHLGDIVQNGERLEEWDLAKQAMNLLLEVGLAHGTVMGNHDDIEPPDLEHGQTYQTNYLSYFGPKVFEDCPWYAGTSPGGAANYQLMEHQGYRILFLNFSIDHPQAELVWARGVIEANPDALIIVGTHRYLYDFKLFAGRYGETVQTPFGEQVVDDNPVPGAEDPNNGEELFNELVRTYPNIFMIHAGHFHSEWLRQDAVNAGGNPLIQILTDYQSTRNGGDGWLRIYSLDFQRGRFEFNSYSPTLRRVRSTIDHFVETIYLAWEQREDIMPLLGIDPDAPNADTLYRIVVETQLKLIDGAPNFLAEHPDYDGPRERAYYRRYLSELFLGNIPAGFEDITAFQKLWVTAFAADPEDYFDFSDGPRSPSGSVEVDFDAYLTPVGPARD